MGATKRTNYSDQQLQLADLFKALGHPARIAIVENLLSEKLLKCKEIQKRIPLAQSTVSQHIKELYTVGIIGYELQNNCAYYKVNDSAIALINNYIDKVKCTLDEKHQSLINTYFKPNLFIQFNQELRI